MPDQLKLIIDCDAGIDDAEAIMFALSQPKDIVDVLAITCVDGNTCLDNVVGNVLRILKLCNRPEIPVFRGAERPLLGSPSHRAEEFHGADGLGGIAHTMPLDHTDKAQEELAPSAIIRLVRQHPGKITIVAMGPLTNLVLAQRCYGIFGDNIQELILMGGDYSGRGNRQDLATAEFNFGHDPEAAAIILNEFRCPIHIIPFDTCKKTTFSWDWHSSWLSGMSDKSVFLKQVHKSFRKSLEFQTVTSEASRYFSCDPYAMIYAFDKSIAAMTISCYAAVEQQGSHLSRGRLVVDERKVLRKLPNVVIVTEIDAKLLGSHLEKIV